MAFAQRLNEIRSGFQLPFWVANFTEIFERVAYYSTTAVLAIYLTEQLHFSSQLAGTLQGIASFVVYALAILAGTLADRFGFRRTLMLAYTILTVGYFLLGSLETSWMAPLRHAIGDTWLVSLVLLVPSLGPGLVKPVVAGTTARASSEKVRSLGYSIYYTLVNIGGTVGPLMAWVVREKMGWGIANVFRFAALSVFLMFWVTLLFYREPGKPDDAKVASIGRAFLNMFIVLGNLRYVTFLLISSGFYVVYWQIFFSAPVFLRRFVNPHADVDRILSLEGATIICFQILVAYLTQKIPAVQAIAIGFLIAALSWVLLAVHPSTFAFGILLVVLALGELLQASRYYEYCSRLAPPGQQGLYMGYAFLPIAIGSAVGGPLGGYLLHEFGDVLHRPAEMWWVVAAVGVLTAALMLLYDRIVKPLAASPAA
ncbi:MAG TPA: MFS transporter [Candidatus Baltobacteraceae bacterium]|nr:MFS transporter [Candidatus Baltobacteraceae bacterium]